MAGAPTAALLRALRDEGLSPQVDPPMARLGFWRIGGPADLYIEVAAAEALSAVRRHAAALAVPVLVLGNGSNLLVSDRGVRGLVLRLVGAFRESSAPRQQGGDTVVDAGGGMLNTALLGRLKRLGLGGLGSLAGVPGTLGGAIRMNAGWSLGEIGDRVVSVQLCLPSGETLKTGAEALDFAYRRARLPAGAIVVSATLRVEDDPARVAAEAADLAHYLQRRKQTQPLNEPSCGSVFKNPPGDHAGRLVEAAGLKGQALGGARISDRHANFIVNTGGATAADVLGLITLARQRVWSQSGVLLEPEVHAVGDWTDGGWPLPDPS